MTTGQCSARADIAVCHVPSGSVCLVLVGGWCVGPSG